MTRKQFLLLFVGLSLLNVMAAACSGLSPSPTPTLPPPTPTSPIPATESLAQAFVTTYEAKQAADWLALFSNDALFMDNGNPAARKEGVMYMRDQHTYVKYLFALPHFSMKFSSHFVSDDGRFIALSGTYTFTDKKGEIASVPIMIILEVKDGKIVREDDYYDGSPFFY
jgi:ketosteroid isomerase-like protein